jgi:dTDP-4-amino-4,6-dideoxygalactose transaminase
MRINVTRSSMPPLDEYVDEIRELWETRWLTNTGIKHNMLEAMLKDYLGVDGISLMCNGHLALEMCLAAFELSGEVITTPFTFASTTHAIARNGLTPVFCDIDPETYTIDAGKIESLITEKTSAILPVHVYGNICDIEAIDAIGKRHKLKVIYDAAHAFGVKYKGMGAGVFGDASMFSFHATKVFHTIEGGAVCFHDPDIGKLLRRLKNFGISNLESVDHIGSNAKMNEFCAAMGICNLRHVDEEIAKRKAVYEAYSHLLADTVGLLLPKIQRHTTPNYAYYPVVVNEKEFGMTRDELEARLVEKDIFARKYFYPLTNTFDCYRGRYDSGCTPVALDISKRVIALPIYAGLEFDAVSYLCEEIKRICKLFEGRNRA